MRPPVWHAPVALSPAEHTIVARIQHAKLFVFLRQKLRRRGNLHRNRHRISLGR
jgi:hypothetical protein